MPSYGIVMIELFYQREELCFRAIGRKAMLKGRHAGLQGLLGLGADIDLACGIAADEDNRESRFDAAAHEFRDVAGNDYPQSCRLSLAIDDVCRHRSVPKYDGLVLVG
jgi:hypothetical protein